jgi:ABC-type spermidine/putrescine transport system permease subunit I
LVTAPLWLWFAFVFVIPFLYVIRYSFGTKIPDSGGAVDLGDLTLDRYKEALTGTLLKVLVRTLEISTIGTLLCLVVALPVAYWLAVHATPRWQFVILGLIIIPFWTNFLIRTVSWRIVLAPRGLISETLQSWGITDRPLTILDSLAGVQLGIVYNYLPLMILPLFVAFGRLDKRHREAAKDLFAGRFATFMYVTLPAVLPGIAAACLLVFIPLSGDYITARVLGGAEGTMIGALVASQFLEAQNAALGAATAVVLVLCVLLVLAVAAGLFAAFLWLIPRLRGFPPATALARWRQQRRQARMRRATPSGRRTPHVDVITVLLKVWTGAVLVFLYLPIAFLVAHSFTASDSMFKWGGFSTKWYGAVFENGPLLDSLKVSAALALGATLLSAVAGTLTGVALARAGKRAKGVLLGLMLLILVAPEIVMAIGLQIWFIEVGGPLRTGMIPLWIAVSVFSTALTALLVRSRILAMDPSLEAAASDLYATPPVTLRKVIVPIAMPAIITSALLSLTLALDNTITAQFVSLPGTTPYSVLAFSTAIRGTVRPSIAAASTMILLLTLLVLALAVLYLRRSGKSGSESLTALTGAGDR